LRRGAYQRSTTGAVHAARRAARGAGLHGPADAASVSGLATRATPRSAAGEMQPVRRAARLTLRARASYASCRFLALLPRLASMRTPMNRFARPLCSLLALALFALPAPAHSQGGAGKAAAPPAAHSGTPAPGEFTSPKLKGWINGVPDTGQFLPDSVWLLRVGPRVSTAATFVERWFAAYPPDRPGQDSTGRVEFLSSIMDKDLLGLTAARIGKPL